MTRELKNKSFYEERNMVESESESHSVMSNSLHPHGLYSPWSSLGQNTGVGSHSPLQGIFPTQGLNPGLPAFQADSVLFEPPRKPHFIFYV